jgi:hypothetical protein
VGVLNLRDPQQAEEPVGGLSYGRTILIVHLCISTISTNSMLCMRNSTLRLSLLSLCTFSLLSCASLGYVAVDREVGQFDPLQNGIPDASTVDQSCGAVIRKQLYTLSDGQANVSYAWQKFQVQTAGASAGGVSIEEKSSAVLRYDSLREAVSMYKTNMADFRVLAADVTGPNSATCEQTVLLVVESIYQAYESTISAVETQASGILNSL